MGKVHAGLASHGMAWFAHEQTAGKGQRGKTWTSEPGMNIALSLVLEPRTLAANQQFYLSAAIALACMDFFSHYAGTATVVKWPNDLYWRDRKAGGILIENVFQGSLWKYAVVGIGININQIDFEPDLAHPVSLKQITGNEFDVELLARSLYQQVLDAASALSADAFESILSRYNRHLYKQGTLVQLKQESNAFETFLIGVNGQGQLETIDSELRKFDFGSVEWIRDAAVHKMV